MDDGGITKTDMHGRCAAHAIERGIEPGETELPRLLWPRLHIGLVDLHNISAGGKQLFDLGIHRRRIVKD